MNADAVSKSKHNLESVLMKLHLNSIFVKYISFSFFYAARNCSWWCGTVVERRSLTGELSLSCARPAADG